MNYYNIIVEKVQQTLVHYNIIIHNSDTTPFLEYTAGILQSDV